MIRNGPPFEHGSALGRGRRFGRSRRGGRTGCGGRARSGRGLVWSVSKQGGGLRVQRGLIPWGRIVIGCGRGRRRGGKDKAALGAHLFHPCLALAAYGERDGDAHAKDIIDGLRQLFVQMVRPKKAHGDLIRAGEQNPAVLQRPARIGDPRGQRGALAAQKVRQNGLVAVQVAKKRLAQGRACNAQRHRQLGKQLAQPALQQQVITLRNQLVAQKAHVRLVGAFFI